MSNQPIQFQVGETYEVRSLGDWDCIFSFEVVGRTYNFITINDGSGDKRVKTHMDQEMIEWAKPYGTYSMSPTIRANRKRV